MEETIKPEIGYSEVRRDLERPPNPLCAGSSPSSLQTLLSAASPVDRRRHRAPPAGVAFRSGPRPEPVTFPPLRRRPPAGAKPSIPPVRGFVLGGLVRALVTSCKRSGFPGLLVETMDNVDSGGNDAEDNIATKDDADKPICPSDIPIEMVPQSSVEFESGDLGPSWSIDPPHREGKKRKLEKGKTETPKPKQISIAPNTPLCRVLSPFPQTLLPIACAISQSVVSAPVDAGIQCGTKPAPMVAILTSPLPGPVGAKPSISPVSGLVLGGLVRPSVTRSQQSTFLSFPGLPVQPMDNVDNGGKDAEANITTKDDTDKPIRPSDVPIEMVPQLYMEFESDRHAYDFYNRYAIKAGFSVRRGRDHRNKSGELQDKSFFCSCEGYSVKDKRDENVKGSRLLTRNGCKAHMKISNRPTGKFRVVRFVAEHNHKLAPPNMCHLLRSQRFLPTVVERANNGGTTPRASANSEDSHTDGNDDCTFVHVDYKNSLCTKRARQMKVGDAGGLLEYLQQMGEDDPNFFYAIQVDAEDKITNIFWADGKMIIDYGYFGDVICFDTTYKRLNENFPFCSFLGVNNHKQTIVFGAAFLYDQSVDTFKWLFDTFIKAMGGKKPKTILTEHDEAMSNALASHWPETHHRLCLWHIYQDIVRQLSNLTGINSKFSKDLQSCLYDYEEENEFEDAWCTLLKKYDLMDNAWLSQLFAEKENWALAYGRDKFCADMTDTQKNDCMNNQLKRYINSQLDIRQFLQLFNTLVEDVRDEELRKDFKASLGTPTLVFQSEILKQAALVYTPTLFLLFQGEMEKVWDSEMIISSEVGTLSEYKITPFGRTHPRTVKFSSENCAVVCSCQKFEFMGILCSHALKIMAFKNTRRIPDQYIVKRWTKDAKDRRGRINHEFTAIMDPKKELAIRHRDLRINFNKLAAKAAESEETYVYALAEVDRLLLQVEDKLKSGSFRNHNLPGCSEIADMDASNDNRIMDYDNESPLTSRGIRRKKLPTCINSKRKKNSFAKAMPKGKAQKEMPKLNDISPYSQPIMVQTNNIMSAPFSQQEPREPSVLSTRAMDRCTSQPFTIVQPSPHEMYQPITNSEAFVHAMSYQNSNVPNGQGSVGMNQALGQSTVTCKWI